MAIRSPRQVEPVASPLKALKAQGGIVYNPAGKLSRANSDGTGLDVLDKDGLFAELAQRGRYLRQEITGRMLYTLASGQDKTVLVQTYLGLEQSLQGQQDAALGHLRWVRKNADRQRNEYRFAVAEIDRLQSKATNAPAAK